MRKEIAEKIDSAPASQVDLKGMDITDTEIADITDSIIEKKTNIEKLFLDYNKLTDIGAKNLSDKLSALPELTFITVEHNKIGQKGFSALFDHKYKALNQNNKKEFHLALHGNLLHNVGEVEKLARASKAKFENKK